MARGKLEYPLSARHERMGRARFFKPCGVAVEADARITVVYAVKIGHIERFYHRVAERTAARADHERSERLRKADGIVARRTHGAVYLAAAVFVGYHDKTRDAALDKDLDKYISPRYARLRRRGAEVVEHNRNRQNTAQIGLALKTRQRVGVRHAGLRRGGRLVAARCGGTVRCGER